MPSQRTSGQCPNVFKLIPNTEVFFFYRKQGKIIKILPSEHMWFHPYARHCTKCRGKLIPHTLVWAWRNHVSKLLPCPIVTARTVARGIHTQNVTALRTETLKRLFIKMRPLRQALFQSDFYPHEGFGICKETQGYVHPKIAFCEPRRGFGRKQTPWSWTSSPSIVKNENE
jgi:hypothetical protein